MNQNRSYLRSIIIAAIVMIGTISAAYAAPIDIVVSGQVVYEDGSVCNDPTVGIANMATGGMGIVETNESSNYYVATLNVSINDTLQFTATSPDESQSSVTEYAITQNEMDAGSLVYDITLAGPGDITPPEITSVAIDPAEVENGSITVTVTAADDSGIASVTADGIELALVVNDTYEGVIPAASAPGTYNVTVVATDASDNNNMATDESATYTVQDDPGDTTSPEITSVLLDLAEVENGSITVTVTAADDSGIASVTADGIELALVVNDTYEGVIPAASAPGTYNVTVVATDASDNNNTATDESATYTVQDDPGDITPPEIALVMLDPAEVEPNGSITVTVNATDDSGIASVTADGIELLFVANDTYEGTIVAASAPGVYNVLVVVTDDSANSNSVTDNLTTYTVQGDPRDITPPEITSVAIDPAEVENGSITVTVTATDDSGIASVTADGIELALVVNDTYEGVIPAASAPGTYNVTVVATDASDNNNTATDESATYTVQDDPGDITPPEITSVLLNPEVVFANGSIIVTVTATDDSGIAGVTADGIALLLVANDTYEGEILAASALGVYNVTVVATDASDNNNTAMDNLTTYTVQEDSGDITPPEITSVLLDPEVVLSNGSITVTVTATDDSGIASVTADGIKLSLVANDTYEGTIVAASTPGVYNVLVVATDASDNNNTATDDSATYEVRLPVTLSIEDVTLRQGWSETVPIMVFDVVDMGGCEVNFVYDPTVVYVTEVTRGDMNFSFEYNINNGSGWMRANALDVKGVSGDVVFAYVTLTAVGNKSDISEMVFEDSRLVDASFGEITHVRAGGMFSIVSNVMPVVTNASATLDTILYDNGRPRAPGTNISLLSAYVTDADGNITTVTIDLSPIGGSPVQPMAHVAGDMWAVITNATEIAINIPDFVNQLTITATDNDGGISDPVNVELTVLKRGDVNGDGYVNKMDADYISRYLAGLEPEVSMLVGDVVGEAGDPMGNGVVDLMDALYIAKCTEGMVEEP